MKPGPGLICRAILLGEGNSFTVFGHSFMNFHDEEGKGSGNGKGGDGRPGS